MKVDDRFDSTQAGRVQERVGQKKCKGSESRNEESGCKSQVQLQVGWTSQASSDHDAVDSCWCEQTGEAAQDLSSRSDQSVSNLLEESLAGIIMSLSSDQRKMIVSSTYWPWSHVAGSKGRGSSLKNIF